MTSNAATPSQVAALEAYANPEAARAAVQDMLGAFRRRRDLVVRLVEEHLPGFGYVYPRGAFYLFLRVDHTYGGAVLDSASFSSRILEETGVALVPGVAFGDDRYVRLSFATSDAILEESIRRMAGALVGAAPRV